MSSTLSSRMDDGRAAQVRGLLVDTVEAGSSRRAAPTARPRRVSRSVVAFAVTVGALGLGGAAVSLTQFLQSDRLTMYCVLGVDAESRWAEKRATVSDPVAACRREWDAAEVPGLVVFMNPSGTVFVAPPTWDAASQGASLVAQDVAFDPRPARLQAALDDWIDGLPASCLTDDEAVSRVEDDLVRLNLLGWTVRRDDDGGREEPADGVLTCASATILEEGEKEVVVRTFTSAAEVSGPPLAAVDDAQFWGYWTERYEEAVASGTASGLSEQDWVRQHMTAGTLEVRDDLRELRAAFDSARCLSAGQAAQEATALLDPSWNPVVDVAVDDTLGCAVVEAGMGGTWIVSVVGPDAVVGGEPADGDVQPSAD